MSIKNSSLYLDNAKRILDFFGLWPQLNSSVIRKIWLAFIFTIFDTFFVFECGYVIQVWGDFNEVSEASYLLVTHSSLCYKALIFVMKRKNLIRLLELMDNIIFEPKSNVQEEILINQATRIKRLCLFYLTSAAMSGTVWAMLPLLMTNERYFPYKLWMPVSPETSPQYELGYLYQVISAYISAFNFIGVDSVIVTLIMFASAQLEIIMDKMKKVQNVSYTAMLKRERDDLIKINNEILVECIKQHQMLEKFINLVTDTFSGNIFYQLCGTVAIVCNIGLRISRVEDKGSQFSMFNHLLTMILQLFLYCWFGNHLTIASEQLQDCLYMCPWYQQDFKFNQALWITMERMKNPIVIKVGHYIPLSRPTFVAILRCSYSYFAILNSLKD